MTQAKFNLIKNSDIKIALIFSFVLHILLVGIFGINAEKKKELVNIPIQVLVVNEPTVYKKQNIESKKEKDEVKKKKEVLALHNKQQESIKKEKKIKRHIEDDYMPSLSNVIDTVKKKYKKNIVNNNFISDVKFEKIFLFDYYTRIIKTKVTDNWDKPFVSGNNARTIIYFQINRQGNVVNIRIYKSSNDKIFDDKAYEAIKKSSPFPALPDGYKENFLGIYFGFEFS